MDTSSGIPVGNDGTSLRFQMFAVRHACTLNAPQTEKIDVYLFQAQLEPSYDNA
jgi:hypothetical protein